MNMRGTQLEAPCTPSACSDGNADDRAWEAEAADAAIEDAPPTFAGMASSLEVLAASLLTEYACQRKSAACCSMSSTVLITCMQRKSR
jgi:hypothetical protein